MDRLQRQTRQTMRLSTMRTRWSERSKFPRPLSCELSKVPRGAPAHGPAPWAHTSTIYNIIFIYLYIYNVCIYICILSLSLYPYPTIPPLLSIPSLFRFLSTMISRSLFLLLSPSSNPSPSPSVSLSLPLFLCFHVSPSLSLALSHSASPRLSLSPQLQGPRAPARAPSRYPSITLSPSPFRDLSLCLYPPTPFTPSYISRSHPLYPPPFRSHSLILSLPPIRIPHASQADQVSITRSSRWAPTPPFPFPNMPRRTL